MSDHSSSNLSRPASPVSPLPPTARPYRFNWDPAQKGPESVSGTTEGRDYFAGPSRLNLFNTSSASLALGALPPAWSSSTHGFHAISTVLNNPHKRQAPPKAHSSLPAVAPADLPRVRRKDFDSYLRAITPEWERLEHSNQINRDGRNAARGRTSISATHGPSMPSPSKTLPTMTPAADPTALSYSLPLLEKFSHYADTVEQHLVREISLRSASFFAALSNLHELQTESEECLDRISNFARSSRMKQDANFGESTRRGQICGWGGRMTGVAKGLVAAGQWDQALCVLEDMERLWDGPQTPSEPPTPTPHLLGRSPSHAKLHGTINGRVSSLPPTPEERPPPSPVLPPPIIPLSSLTAFAALPTHLRTLTTEITSSLSAELVSVLRVDLLERISTGAPNNNDLPSLKDRLRPLLQGLTRTKGVREATLSWREVVLDEMRGVIRRHIPAFELTDGESGSSTPSAGTAFLEVLQRTSSKTPPNTTALQEELSDILSSAAELSNTEAAKLIIMRAEQHAVLNLSDFITFFNDSWSFVVKCEVVCRKMIVGLRGVVISQSKTFLQTFHQARLTQSAGLVENEQWEQTDATPAIQHIADMLVDSAVRDVPELLLVNGTTPAIPVPSSSAASLPSLSSSASLTPASSTNSINGVPPSPSAPAVRRANGSSQAKNAKIRLRVEDRTFSSVSATSEALSLLLDYLRVIMNLSMLTTDTMSRVIEFLKAFNSRTCQVVLGAGAMRSAGLKNITAKHLALASQSLSIMIALIPYVRETFRRHLSQKQAVMLVEFDKLKRDYQEHQNEIHAKLIAIMGDRLTTHIRTFQSVDWNVPQKEVNAYMAVLVRETVTLHKVLSRHLSDVMAQVFAAINHRLSEEYAKLVLPSEDARKGLLMDARFLHQKLSELKNVGAPSGMLEIVIAELRVPQPVSPSANATNFNNAKSNPTANSNPRLLANRLRWNSLAPQAAANGNAVPSNPSPSVNGSAPNSKTASPVTSPTPSVNGAKSPPPLPLLSAPDAMAAAGFRQVDPGSPRPESPRPESPLPALPPEAMAASVSSETVAVASKEAEKEVFEDPLGASTPTRSVHTPAPATPRISTPAPMPTPPAFAPTSPPLPAVPAPSEELDIIPPPTADGGRTPEVQTATETRIEDDSKSNPADNGIGTERADRDSPTPTPPFA
ncbi:Vps54-like protein-domain-containing protein [Mycena crocata]|nr:Vps54-like protein-domain-containing protein [Mycena crocata]